MKNLKNNTWPLENSQIFQKIRDYIQLSNYLLSLMSAKKFIKTFSNDTKILTKPFVNRKAIKKKNNWSQILKEAEFTMNSLLTKSWVVELVFKSNN